MKLHRFLLFFAIFAIIIFELCNAQTRATKRATKKATKKPAVEPNVENSGDQKSISESNSVDSSQISKLENSNLMKLSNVVSGIDIQKDMQRKLKDLNKKVNKRLTNQNRKQEVGNHQLGANDYDLRDLDDQKGAPVGLDTAMIFTIEKINTLLSSNNLIPSGSKFPSDFQKEGNDELDSMRIFSETFSIDLNRHDSKIGSVSVNLNIDKLQQSGYTGQGPDKSHIGFEIKRKIDADKRTEKDSKEPSKHFGHVFI